MGFFKSKDNKESDALAKAGALMAAGKRGDPMKYMDAIRQLDIVLNLNPSIASAWGMKGMALVESGATGESLEEAIRCLDTALQSDPTYALASLAKGQALLYQNKYVEALQPLIDAMKWPNLQPEAKNCITDALGMIHVTCDACCSGPEEREQTSHILAIAGEAAGWLPGSDQGPIYM